MSTSAPDSGQETAGTVKLRSIPTPRGFQTDSARQSSQAKVALTRTLASFCWITMTCGNLRTRPRRSWTFLTPLIRQLPIWLNGTVLALIGMTELAMPPLSVANDAAPRR